MTYTTTVQTYKGIPFSYRLKKSHYYDIAGSMKGGEILLESTFQSYPGLNMSYYQGTGSLMTVTVDSGTLPNHSYSQGAFGCLATVNEGPDAGLYTVLKSSYVNYTKVGSPTINTETGVVSGFSSSNYLTLGTFSPQGNTWEYYIKFTTGSSTSAQGLSTCVGSSNGCSPFYIDNGNLIAFLSSNGSSWNIASSETIMSISANTTYKMKAEYTGTAYNWYLWQNNSWTLKKTITSSSAIYDGLTMLLGNNRGQNNPFGGTIDLSETYITIGGSTWWSPVGDIPATATGLLPSGVTDDGTAQTWNLFYNNGDYKLNTASTMSGYSWCGEIAIPAHTV